MVGRISLVALLVAAAIACWFLTADWTSPGIWALGVYRERFLLLNLAVTFLVFWLCFVLLVRPRGRTLARISAAHFGLLISFCMLEGVAALGLVDFRLLFTGEQRSPNFDLLLRKQGCWRRYGALASTK